MNVSLTPYYEAIIEKAIASGIYANASETVRASLRLLEKELAHETKLKELRAAIEQAENSGDPVPLDIEKIIARGKKRYEMHEHDVTEPAK